MKQSMFTITKDRLEAMRVSEKAEYLDHMLADMGMLKLCRLLLLVI